LSESKDYIEIDISGEQLLLLPEKAVFWPGRNTMILSDLHLGKVNHFRRSGIPVPTRANQKNLEIMISIFQHWKPDRVIFLGDLFHSHYNQEWEVFGQVLNHFPAVSFELVMGNHDIMSEHQYLKHRLVIHDPVLIEKPFIFSHDELDNIPEGLYLLCGHVHPGVIIKGKGRQRMRLPCFYFGERKGLLPAFGEFTGIHPVNPFTGDKIFVIAGGQVVAK
jgi:DNA ligase-associated metallophosphoesterase